jgi:predicted nucleotidyltransferase
MTERPERVDDGRAVLDEAVGAFQAALGPRLVAAYALGSLAHGGFSPLVSDVDLGLVLADPPTSDDPETLRAVAESVKAGGSVLHERLSVFWGTPATLRGDAAGGRFPSLDRLDLVENGRLLAGEDVRAGLPAPDRVELLVAGAEFALDFLGPGLAGGAGGGQGLGSLAAAGETVMDEIRHPDTLLAGGPRHVTKIVLFPVRFLYTAATGRVGTNEAAAAHHLAQAGAPGHDLVAAALRWRTTPPDDLPAAAGLLGRELLPLYVLYLEDHTARLTELGEVDLAASFARWRAQLLA